MTTTDRLIQQTNELIHGTHADGINRAASDEYAGEATLESLGLDPYPALIIRIGHKAHDFLRHLAKNAQTTPDDLATEFLTDALEREANVLVEILTKPDPEH